MTREIKFRAWDKDGQYMRTETPFDIHYNSKAEMFAKGEDVILMQFTGLKDKNGAEIYEGDLISWGNGDPCEVRFVEQGIQWEGEGKFYVNFWAVVNPNPLGFDRSIYPLEDRSGDVIGNIYENAELLEAVK